MMSVELLVERKADSEQARSQTSLAYSRIKRAIIRCELEPGSPVTEEELAERFNVGRATVRPALQRLRQERLIHAVSIRKHVIAPLTLTDAQDLFATRQLLEPPAAKLAAGRIDAERLRRLDELSEIRYQPGDDESAERFVAANTEIHATIARSSGNELLAELIVTLLDRYERLNHLSHMLRDRSTEASHEHHELVHALFERDGERAQRVMSAQISAARSFVIDAMISSRSVQAVNVFSSDSRGK
jgi:DNA-binding GntR family transcriptional regulator